MPYAIDSLDSIPVKLRLLWRNVQPAIRPDRESWRQFCGCICQFLSGM
jgi:hypothetical protein